MKRGEGKAFIQHFCARCGKPIERKRYHSLANRRDGGLESVASYNRRRFCSLACGSYHERSDEAKKCIRCKRVLPKDEFEMWKGKSDAGTYLEIPLNVCRDCKNLEEVIWRWETDRSGSMLTNAECGLYIWEHGKRIILQLFPDVREMPHLNHGYNFICSNRKKLAVRAGRILRGHASPTWSFHTKNNDDADYIACFAFKDMILPLRLLHLWIIPHDVFGGKKWVTMTGSDKGLNKWKKYEMTTIAEVLG